MALDHRYNLYLLTNETVGGYDTYDSCVVCAETAEEAILISPEDNGYTKREAEKYCWGRTWCNTPDEVIYAYIGKANSTIKVGSVVIASFNAG